MKKHSLLNSKYKYQSYEQSFKIDDTKFIKGIAIVLMLCNHLFPILEWIYPENQYISLSIGSKTVAAYFGGFSKICVALFAFLTGIGLCHTYTNKSIGGGYKHTLKKLLPFFLTYWVILLCIYIPVMSATGVFSFDAKDFFLNLLGYKTTYCRVAWYVRFYLELIILFPAVVLSAKVICKKIGSCLATSAILLLGNWTLRMIFMRFDFPGISYVIEFLNYLPVVIVGYYAAWNSVFEKCAEKLSKMNLNKLILCGSYLCIFLCMFVARGILTGKSWFNIDVILSPIFVFCTWFPITSLENNKVVDTLKNGIGFLGKYSLEIWFLHAIFFIGDTTVQKIAYWPRIDIFILIWTIILLIPFAVLVHKLSGFITSVFTKLINLNIKIS